MIDDEIKEAIGVALEGPTGREGEIASRLIELLDRRTEGRAAIESGIFGSGGYAFAWEDVLGLSDAAAATAAVIANLPVADAALVLLAIFEFWKRLRRNRIELTKNEMRVLLAVKRGCRTARAIAASAGLDESAAASVVDGLKSRFYHDRIPLMEGGEGGFSTDF